MQLPVLIFIILVTVSISDEAESSLDAKSHTVNYPPYRQPTLIGFSCIVDTDNGTKRALFQWNKTRCFQRKVPHPKIANSSG